MWFFRKKQTLEESGFFRGFTDWHSHILPGVDDGVQTMEEALQILSEYERLGVKEVWLTPHIMEDIPNTSSRLRERFGELQSAYTGNVILHLAAENMLDSLFEERLAQNDFLPIGAEGNHLLVETSYFNPPMDMYELLERIKQKGYNIILAHPERYLYMDENEYKQLKAMGVKFQLNLFSITGLYGKEVKKKAKSLKSRRMYEYIGTDLHRIKILNRMLHSEICPEEVGFQFKRTNNTYF